MNKKIISTVAILLMAYISGGGQTIIINNYSAEPAPEPAPATVVQPQVPNQAVSMANRVTPDTNVAMPSQKSLESVLRAVVKALVEENRGTLLNDPDFRGAALDLDRRGGPRQGRPVGTSEAFARLMGRTKIAVRQPQSR
jgi:hypothetical protein